MESASAWDLIFLGTSLRFITDVGIGWNPHAHGGLVENYDLLLKDCGTARLVVSRGVVIIALMDVIDRLRASDAGYVTTRADVEAIRTGVEAVRVALMAESASSVIYRTTKRRYDVVRLMGDVGELFGDSTFGSISAIARYDFGEAGRCVAFGLPTAAAFHLLRGTEEVVRMYYISWIRRGRMRTMLWGPMVNALRGVRGRQKPDATVLNHLDNMRVSFRNPTDHPEKVYDIGETEDLFGLCIEVVNRMARTKRS